MNIYKRIGSLILSLLLVFSMFSSTFSVQTFAATTPAFSIENKTVGIGEEFTVAVSLANATSGYGGSFTLQYDSDLLSIDTDSYEFGTIINGTTMCNTNYQSAGNLIRVVFNGATAISSDGILITFTFTAKASGTATLSFNNYKVVDENGSAVSSVASGSVITISPEPVVSPTVSVTSKTVTVGDAVNVPIVITDSSDVYGGNFTLQYDSSLLSIDSDSYEFGTIVSGTTMCNTDYQAKGNLIRVVFNGAEAVSSDGTLITLTFTAKSTGTASLQFNACKMVDKNGNSIVTTASGNTIVIEPEPTPDNFITGKCGSNVYFDLNLDDGTIVIYGEGDMFGKYYYLNNNIKTPWYDYREKITSVKIQDGVTSVGYASFAYCNNLISATIADTVTNIEMDAFDSCEKLVEIVLPESLTTVGESAFYNTGITSISLPDSVETVGRLSFANSDICYIYIGEKVTSIEYGAFSTCQSLTNIEVNSSNDYYCSVDGVLFSKNKELLIQYPCAKGQGASYNIPNGTTTLYNGSFNETSLIEITIPDTVTKIESSVFSGCYVLKTVRISKSVTNIESAAFSACPSITDVYYNGTEEEWNKILVEDYNDYLLNATFHFQKPIVNLIDISISSYPETIYYIGDSLSTSDLKLLVTYSDGTTETVTSGFAISGFSSTSAGTKTVTVSYEGFTDTYSVTIHIPEITLSSSSKTMSVGDSISINASTTPSGQSVTWTSSNTSVATVSGGIITAKASGSATITAKFNYNGKTYSETCSVTVEDVPVPPTPESLSVSSKPTKTTYEIGESLNTSGLKLKLTYSDGTYENITSGFTTSGFSSTTTGTKTVTVKYSGLTTTFTVTVTSTPDPTPTSLSVSSKPTKTTYEIGESLNTSGLKLKLTYSDGTYENITSGFTTSGFSSTTAGTKTVAVKYIGLTTTFTVTVKEPEPDIDENAPQIVLESKKTTKGKEFTVLVTIKNNPGFSYLEVTPSHSSELTLVKVENGDLVSDFTKGKQYVWVSDEDVTTDGVLLTFTFSVDDSVEAGNYQINFNVRTCANYDEESVSFNVVKADIEVLDCVYGDATGDGKIDGFDVIRLKKYLANYDYDTESSSVEATAGADANGDGKIDGFDVIRLKKYLANYDYETGESTVVLGPQ